MTRDTQTLRAVLDTNVYLSGLLFGGRPATLVSEGLFGSYRIICSVPILSEFREKLEEKFGWSPKETQVLLQSLLPAMSIVDIPGTLHAVPADPEDNPIIETALVGNAGYVVTGDAHLLRLRQYDDVRIVSIDQFFRLLAEQRTTQP